MTRCIAAWPDAGKSVPSAPLAEEPRVLWRKPLSERPTGFDVILAGDRVVFTASQTLLVYDLGGNFIASENGSSLEVLSTPTADAGSRVYFAGFSLYSTDVASGGRGWTHSFSLDPGWEGQLLERVIIDSSGAVYGAAHDGFLYSWTSTGEVRWRRAIGANPVTLSTVFFGIGDALSAQSVEAESAGGPKGLLFDSGTGSAIGAPLAPDGNPITVLMAGPTIGLVGFVREARGAPIALHISSPCGDVRWSLPATLDRGVGLLLPGDRLLVWSRPLGAVNPLDYTLYSPDGTELAGPRSLTHLITIAGADGTLYGTECDPSGAGTGSLVAFGDDLAEKWRLPLDRCSCSSALAPSGILYRACDSTPDPYLEAVQTVSPGVADSSWPVYGAGDTRNSRWVTR